MNIKEQLDQLADVRLMRDNLAREKEALLAAAVPAEVKAALEEIEAEFSDKFERIDQKISSLEFQVKEAVIFEGTTVKGEMLTAVYTKGRVSWDSKALDAMGTMIPAILSARKEGEPSVSIRWKQ